MKKRKNINGLKSYNQEFIQDDKIWSVVHKTTELIYAVEVNKKGIAGGGILRFPRKDLEI
tara:strand:+ start:5039 stop:5218 length:180 start_codon:yes stop_codon:yes gene_type:complete